jgi:hypothetical protein
LTGTLHSAEVAGTLTGSVSGSHLTLSVEAGNGARAMRIRFDGRLSGEALAGIWEIGTKSIGKWSATRLPGDGGAEAAAPAAGRAAVAVTAAP